MKLSINSLLVLCAISMQLGAALRPGTQEILIALGLGIAAIYWYRKYNRTVTDEISAPKLSSE